VRMAESGGGGSQNQRKKEEKDFFFGRIIGEGSFSQVYLARDVSSGKEVAIKVCKKAHIIREKKQDAIMREKQVMLILTDPNKWSTVTPFFVRLFATFHNADSLYFVLSLAKRGDMLKFIKKMAAQEVDVTQFYAAELVQALEHLHSLKIVHRDLKPENILLSSTMHILLTDFGSAKLMSDNTGVDETDGPVVGRRNSFVGTAQYVSPEILTNSGSTQASDLWALGCILYQMVTGMPPFIAQSEYLIFQKIQALDYSFPEGFDSHAKDLVTKLLVKDSSERLGVLDKVGYPSIKQHSFFNNIEFDSLYCITPPQIKSYVKDTSTVDTVWARHPGMQPGLGAEEMSRMLRDQIESGSLEDDCEGEESEDGLTVEEDQVSITSEIITTGNIGDLSDDERSRLLDLQRENNEYHKFVEGHLILKQGILDKKKGLWSRRRMFLLTEGPRLFYVDPKEKVLKGEIPWSKDMKTEMKNFRIFFVHTPHTNENPGRIYYLIDPSSYASKWCEAVDRVRDFYFPRP